MLQALPVYRFTLHPARVLTASTLAAPLDQAADPTFPDPRRRDRATPMPNDRRVRRVRYPGPGRSDRRLLPLTRPALR